MSSPLLLPQIPVDEAELRVALESVAIPGYTGSLSVEIGLRPAAEGKGFMVVMDVKRRETKRPGERQRPSNCHTDPERKKPVQSVLDDIRPKLIVRPVLQAIEVQYHDGKVMKYQIAE